MTRYLLLLMLTACAHNDSWDRTDTGLYSAYAVAAIADGYTTTQIQYHDVEEKNPIARTLLGSNPSTADTWQLTTSMMLCNYLIARSLPSTWRKRYLATWAIGHGIATVNNCNHGLC